MLIIVLVSTKLPKKLRLFSLYSIGNKEKINIYYGQTAGQTKYTKKPDSISKKNKIITSSLIL